ncbi:MAG: hypothetical protein L0215_12560 [Gemmataceae bacterium]|nr:hypothetical protein [Gemmataceae bacterium]
MSQSIVLANFIAALVASATGQYSPDTLFRDVPRSVEKRVLRVGTHVGILVVSPDAGLLAHRGQGLSVEIRDFATGELKTRGEPHSFVPTGLMFLSDPKKLLSVAAGGNARNPVTQLAFWDIAAGTSDTGVVLPGGGIPLAIARSGGYLVSTKANDQQVAIAWDIAKQKGKELGGHSGPLVRAAISDDGKFAATQGGPDLFVWDLATGKKNWEKYFERASPNRLDFSPDGRLLLFGYSDTVQLYDTNSGALLGGVRTQGGRFSPDGKWIASPCSNDVWNNSKNGIRIYMVDEVLFPKEGKPKLVLPKVILEPTGPDGYLSMTISPDSRYVVTACSRGVIRVWEVPKLDK